MLSSRTPRIRWAGTKEELSLGIEAIKEELLRREVTIDITTEGNFPKTVYGN